jgi:hypothetical protein
MSNERTALVALPNRFNCVIPSDTEFHVKCSIPVVDRLDAASFFLKHIDRILFWHGLGSQRQHYRLHFRFLETADEYFDYPRVRHGSGLEYLWLILARTMF